MKIVNVTGMTPNAPGVVYCGRASRNRWRQSPWHNPFRLGKDGTREQAIARYRTYLLERIDQGDRDILDALDSLTTDSVLGCWCKPKACHCDVIAQMWESRRTSN
jgi:hypothetical protein